jgi:hypothetical protein
MHPKPGPLPTRVRAMKPHRLRNHLPRLLGYRYDVAATAHRHHRRIHLALHCGHSRKTENAPIVGESSITPSTISASPANGRLC